MAKTLTETLAAHEFTSHTTSLDGINTHHAGCTCGEQYEWSRRLREHDNHLQCVTLNWSDARVADALREAADWIESTDSQKGYASRALSPGKQFAVDVLRQRAASLFPPATDDA